MREWLVKVPDLKAVKDSSLVYSPSITCVEGYEQEYMLDPTKFFLQSSAYLMCWISLIGTASDVRQTANLVDLDPPLTSGACPATALVSPWDSGCIQLLHFS